MMYVKSPDSLPILDGDADLCRCRTVGALLMFFTGLLYLLLEDDILGQTAISSCGSRTVMGIQVCPSSTGCC